jgi:hypothetical protein
MRGLGLGLAALVGVGVGNACLLELDHEIACGDGYVDRVAGEECDPSVWESYSRKCATDDGPRDARCLEDTCDLLDSTLECALCGNGVVETDLGEECDPDAGSIDEIALGKDCSEIRPPYSDTQYISGKVTRCLSDCTWDRTECGFCGNGKVEGSERIWVSSEQVGLESREEWCDEQEFDLDKLSDDSKLVCSEIGAVDNVTCAANCRGFEARDGLPCCIPEGGPCAGPGDTLRCCHEYAVPDETEHCWPRLLPNDADPDDVSGGATCK